jgi:fructose-1,6-bisphosphatase/inositol monophosphatase family enzyme
VFQATRNLVAGLSVSHDFTAVIEGKVDCHLIYKHGGGSWDYAPRALLMREAGARVTNVASDSYDFRNSDVLMAHPTLFEPLMSAITKEV